MQVKRNHLDFEVHLFFDPFFLPVTGQLNLWRNHYILSLLHILIDALPLTPLAEVGK